MKPTGRHTDWPWPFSLIKRGWHTWSSEIEPVQICGNVPEGLHLDIPPRGCWAVAGVGRLPIPVFFAFKTSGGRYLRLALIRYDYVDHYYTVFSFAYRNYAR